MIKMSYMELAHPLFEEAINVINNCPMLDGATSYRVSRLKAAMGDAQKEIRDLRLALVEKYAKKDEKGARVLDERGYIQFESPEKGAEFEAEFTKEFQIKDACLKVNKLDFATLITVKGIKPTMWDFLEPIVDNFPPDEELEEEAVPVKEKVKLVTAPPAN